MRRLIAALAMGSMVALSAQAHFIFIELPPNAPTTAKLRLAEEPLEASGKELQEKAAPMTVKTGDGQEVKFEFGEDSMTATVDEAAPVLTGSLDYGLMTRGGEYLLVYHAKAVRTPELAAKEAGLPVEVLGEVKDGNLNVTVLQGGKPAAGSELVVNLPTAEEQAKATTDEAGKATFPIEPGGWVGVRARVQETRTGEFDGKEYKEVRSYTTLTFPYLED